MTLRGLQEVLGSLFGSAVSSLLDTADSVDSSLG